jgi:hypothetical protein
LAVGSWQLAVGSWQLAVGSWQLAVGSWQYLAAALQNKAVAFLFACRFNVFKIIDDEPDNDESETDEKPGG